MGTSESKEVDFRQSVGTLFKNLDRLNNILQDCNTDGPPTISLQMNGQEYKITFENFKKQMDQNSGSNNILIQKVESEQKEALKQQLSPITANSDAYSTSDDSIKDKMSLPPNNNYKNLQNCQSKSNQKQRICLGERNPNNLHNLPNNNLIQGMHQHHFTQEFNQSNNNNKTYLTNSPLQQQNSFCNKNLNQYSKTPYELSPNDVKHNQYSQPNSPITIKCNEQPSVPLKLQQLKNMPGVKKSGNQANNLRGNTQIQDYRTNQNLHQNINSRNKENTNNIPYYYPKTSRVNYTGSPLKQIDQCQGPNKLNQTINQLFNNSNINAKNINQNLNEERTSVSVLKTNKKFSSIQNQGQKIQQTGLANSKSCLHRQESKTQLLTNSKTFLNQSNITTKDQVNQPSYLEKNQAQQQILTIPEFQYKIKKLSDYSYTEQSQNTNNNNYFDTDNDEQQFNNSYLRLIKGNDKQSTQQSKDDQHILNYKKNNNNDTQGQSQKQHKREFSAKQKFIEELKKNIANDLEKLSKRLQQDSINSSSKNDCIRLSSNPSIIVDSLSEEKVTESEANAVNMLKKVFNKQDVKDIPGNAQSIKLSLSHLKATKKKDEPGLNQEHVITPSKEQAEPSEAGSQTPCFNKSKDNETCMHPSQLYIANNITNDIKKEQQLMNSQSIRNSLNFAQIINLNEQSSSCDNAKADNLMENDGVMLTLKTENNDNENFKLELFLPDTPNKQSLEINPVESHFVSPESKQLQLILQEPEAPNNQNSEKSNVYNPLEEEGEVATIKTVSEPTSYNKQKDLITNQDEPNYQLFNIKPVNPKDALHQFSQANPEINSYKNEKVVVSEKRENNPLQDLNGRKFASVIQTPTPVNDLFDQVGKVSPQINTIQDIQLQQKFQGILDNLTIPKDGNSELIELQSPVGFDQKVDTITNCKNEPNILAINDFNSPDQQQKMKIQDEKTSEEMINPILNSSQSLRNNTKKSILMDPSTKEAKEISYGGGQRKKEKKISFKEEDTIFDLPKVLNPEGNKNHFNHHRCESARIDVFSKFARPLILGKNIGDKFRKKQNNLTTQVNHLQGDQDQNQEKLSFKPITLMGVATTKNLLHHKLSFLEYKKLKENNLESNQ